MKREIAMEWVAELSKYKQGKMALHQPADEGDKFCCLGVLCEMAVRKGIIPEPAIRGYSPTAREPDGTRLYGAARKTNYLPREVEDWAGMRTSDGSFIVDGGVYGTQESYCLANMNDRSDVGFEDIAAVIEKNWMHL